MSIRDNVMRVVEEVEKAKEKAGTKEVVIVAVSKTFPPSAVEECIRAGIKNIGENRVQEAATKFEVVKRYNAVFHMVGHLQKNKVNKAVPMFDVIQSVDSVELAEKIAKKSESIGKTQTVLIEVNTSGEKNKFGIEPDRVDELIETVLNLPSLKLDGFMTVGPLTDDENEIRRSFSMLRKLREQMESLYGTTFPVLSMGMSDDFVVAIEEGSNMVRIGRKIFGERNYG